MAVPTNRDAYLALASTLVVKLFDNWPERIDVRPADLAASTGELDAFDEDDAEVHERLHQLAAPAMDVLLRGGVVEVLGSDLSGGFQGAILSTEAYQALLIPAEDKSSALLPIDKLKQALAVEVIVELGKAALSALQSAWPWIARTLSST